MAYHYINSEGLTFSEWVQAAGLYKPMQGAAYQSGASCAGYTSWFGKPLFSKVIRNAWRNGEDPSDCLPQAPRRWANAPANAGEQQ